MLVSKSVVRIEKVWRVSRYNRLKVIADNLGFYIDQNFIYFSLSFSVEILQFWG